MTINSETVVSGIKTVTKFCMNRTVASSIKTFAAVCHANVVPFVNDNSTINKLARSIGAEAVSLVVTSATSDIIDSVIDDIAEKIVDKYTRLKELNDTKVKG